MRESVVSSRPNQFYFWRALMVMAPGEFREYRDPSIWVGGLVSVDHALAFLGLRDLRLHVERRCRHGLFGIAGLAIEP